jgi:hypothetical protein
MKVLGFHKEKLKFRAQAQWLIPVIPTMREIQVQGSWPQQNTRLLAEKVKPKDLWRHGLSGRVLA